MGNYPLTAKEQHKRKEKLAKICQTVMIILMAIAGLYYMTVERGQVTNAAIMTNVDESTVKTNRNQDKEVQETKFKIESYLQPETTNDETCQTILQEIETPMELSARWNRQKKLCLMQTRSRRSYRALL